MRLRPATTGLALAVRQRLSPRSPPAPVASAGALCRHACLTILPYRCLPRVSAGRRLPRRAAQDWHKIKPTSPPSCAASTATAWWIRRPLFIERPRVRVPLGVRGQVGRHRPGSDLATTWPRAQLERSDAPLFPVAQLGRSNASLLPVAPQRPRPTQGFAWSRPPAAPAATAATAHCRRI